MAPTSRYRIYIHGSSAGGLVLCSNTCTVFLVPGTLLVPVSRLKHVDRAVRCQIVMTAVRYNSIATLFGVGIDVVGALGVAVRLLLVLCTRLLRDCLDPIVAYTRSV